MQIKIYARAYGEKKDAYLYQGSMQIETNFSEGVADLEDNVKKCFNLTGLEICVVFPNEGFVYTF